MFDFVSSTIVQFWSNLPKTADKVDIDGISDEFETWLDRIMNVRVMSPWLLKKSLFDFVISVASSG